MTKDGEEHPLNCKTKDFKNTKKLPTMATIHLGRDGNGMSDIDLNVNTNLTISTSKVYKILITITFFITTFIIVAGSLIFIYLFNEIKTLKTELSLVEQKFEHRLDYLARKPQKLNAMLEDYSHNALNANDYTAEPSVNKQEQMKVNTQNATNMHVVPRISGIAHFIGAIPEISLNKGGAVRPWHMDETISTPSTTDVFSLSDDKESVKINEDGVYFIYAQMIYLSRLPSCYYVVSRNSLQQRRILAECCTGNDSTPFDGSPGEMSCSVSTLAQLTQKDSVYLIQREINRTFLMRDGRSHFGLIRLI